MNKKKESNRVRRDCPVEVFIPRLKVYLHKVLGEKPRRTIFDVRRDNILLKDLGLFGMNKKTRKEEVK